MENIEHIVVEELAPQPNAKIIALGVGGGGSNAIAELKRSRPNKDLVLMVANTDVQHLNSSPVDVKINLGQKLTKGLGAGMKPEIGEKAAEESYEDIKSYLDGAALVFIAAGMGGGTGTGAAPIIAQAARDIGALTYAVVTKPFTREGKKRTRLANEGIAKLKEVCDSIMIVPNEKVLAIITNTTTLEESYKEIDSVLARAVNGMSNIILQKAHENVDFADITTVLSHKGLSLMSVGESSPESKEPGVDAVKKALQSPLFENVCIKNAKGIVLYLEVHKNCPQLAIDGARAYIMEFEGDDTDMIHGIMMYSDEDNWDSGFIRATVMATGFEQEIVSQTKGEDMSSFTLRRRVSGSDTSGLNDLEKPTFLRINKD